MELSLPQWRDLQDKPIADATEGELIQLATNPIFKAAKAEAWRQILQIRHDNPVNKDLSQSLLIARGMEQVFEIFESFSPMKRRGK